MTEAGACRTVGWRANSPPVSPRQAAHTKSQLACPSTPSRRRRASSSGREPGAPERSVGMATSPPSGASAGSPWSFFPCLHHASRRRRAIRADVAVKSLTPDHRRMRVIIVGGGIAGLSTAIGLRQHGHEVVVLERAPRIDPIGAGLTLFANAARRCRRAELGHTFCNRRRAAPLRRVHDLARGFRRPGGVRAPHRVMGRRRAFRTRRYRAWTHVLVRDEERSGRRAG
jgi:NAD(P)-binding Rossmann-like domain